MHGLAEVRVETAPPAGERREIVRRDGGERDAGIGSRRLEPTVVLALEAQDTIAEDVRSHDRVGESLGRGAEILRDDERPGAVALDPQHRQHRVERIGDVDAIRRRHAVGYDVEPLQLERVIDADRAGMAHVGGDKCPEGLQPLLFERAGVEGRQPPSSGPCGTERVRRCADRDARHEPVRPRPIFRAGAVDADGEIAIEADGHAGPCRARLGRRELAVSQPLQPGVERDLLRIGLAKVADRLAIGIAVGLGPFPAPMLALRDEIFGQSLEGRVKLQRFASLGAKGREGRIDAVFEPAPIFAEYDAFDGPRRGMFDERRRAQPVEFGADAGFVQVARRRARREVRKLGWIDEQRIDEEARRWRIG